MGSAAVSRGKCGHKFVIPITVGCVGPLCTTCNRCSCSCSRRLAHLRAKCGLEHHSMDRNSHPKVGLQREPLYPDWPTHYQGASGIPLEGAPRTKNGP